MKLTTRNAKKILKKYLYDNKLKYNHSIRVAKTCKLLAKKLNVSVKEAAIAGLLHDIGKSIPKDKMLDFCSRNKLILHDYDIFYNATSLHGTISAFLTEKYFTKVKEREKLERILNAIKNHTAGSSDMSDLDKIVFIADKLEHEKDENDILDRILKGVISIDEAMLIVIENKIGEANRKGKIYNPNLDATREAILQKIDNSNEKPIVPRCETPLLPLGFSSNTGKPPEAKEL